MDTPFFLAGRSTTDALMRAHDWTASPLGEPALWPQSLKNALRGLLGSSQPLALLWGPEALLFYNDAFQTTFPDAQLVPGQPCATSQPQLWPLVAAAVEQVRTLGVPLMLADQEVLINHDGTPNVSYFTFCLSPVLADGRAGCEGTFWSVQETTRQVLGQRHTDSSAEFNPFMAEDKPKKVEDNDLLIRTLIMQAPVAIGIYRGPDLRIEVANNKLLSFWSKSAYNVMNKPLLEVIPELRDQGIAEILQEVYTSGQRFFASEYKLKLFRRNQAEEIVVSFALEPLYDDDGKVSAVMAVSNEITELIQARQEAEENETRYKLAIEAAEMGTYDLNMLTDELIYSDRFVEIFGMDPTQPLSRNDFRNRVHPDDQLIRTKAHQEALRTGKLLYEARIIWPNGTHRWTRMNGKVVYDAHGTPIRMHGTIMDINEQKIQSDKLEKMVEERTRELKEINTLLKKSNHELEQFAYIASHDLQEPLRKIQTFADVILQNINNSHTIQRYLSKINSSAHRMEDLIRSVLNYSRLSVHSTQHEYTDLNQVLANVLIDYELQIQEKQASIQSDPLPVVKGIPPQLQQLFYNLIGNSLKFSRQQPVIRIRSRFITAAQINIPTEAQPDDKYLELVFQDNGIGFDQQYADQIFTIFQRLHDKQSYTGTGIGLALCKKIVDNHQGYIWAQSQVDHGATFYVYLPRQ